MSRSYIQLYNILNNFIVFSFVLSPILFIFFYLSHYLSWFTFLNDLPTQYTLQSQNKGTISSFEL